MRLAIAILALAACAPLPPLGSNTCGVLLGGDAEHPGPGTLTYAALQSRTDAALDASSTSTDMRFLEPLDLCQKLVGFRVMTRSTPDFPDPFGRMNGDRPLLISGYTECRSKTIVVGTPEGSDWRQSSLVHEFIHVFQDCEAELPVDPGTNEAHANWLRDRIFESIERVRH